MYYGKINKCDIANGEGIRVSLFVSGCRNRCKGCFQPETWDFNYGNEFTEKTAEIIFSAVDNPSVRGLTVLGGEPMEPENQAVLVSFLRQFKAKFLNKTVWLYTGNTYEELTGEHRTNTEYTEELLSLIDILVDGRFVEDEKSLGLRFRGSKNQRVIDMNETRKNACLTFGRDAWRIENMIVKIKKLNEKAIIPTYGTEYSAGADLYALLDSKIEIKPHETVFVHTGLSVEIPEGYCGLVFARSSMGAKRGLAPANKVGVIDSDYRGEIVVTLHNHSEIIQTVEPGERIAQLAILPFLKAEFEETDDLSDTVRGEGGFGSTGTR